MSKDAKESKVAICNRCQGFVIACHIDYISKNTERQFLQLETEGFLVKIETADETIARKYSSYGKCKRGGCAPDHD